MRAPGSNAARVLFVSVGLVGRSRFPRLLLGLELYFERMVTERFLTPGDAWSYLVPSPSLHW